MQLPSHPSYVLNGINDLSVQLPLPEVEQTPIGLPLFFLMTATGPLDARMIMSYDDAIRIYGIETFEQRSIYYNHQTALAISVISAGSPIMIKRVITDTYISPARAATVKLYAGIVGTSTVGANGNIVNTDTLANEYLRNDFGSYVLDAAKRPTLKTTVHGNLSEINKRIRAWYLAQNQLDGMYKTAGTFFKRTALKTFTLNTVDHTYYQYELCAENLLDTDGITVIAIPVATLFNVADTTGKKDTNLIDISSSLKLITESVNGLIVTNAANLIAADLAEENAIKALIAFDAIETNNIFQNDIYTELRTALEETIVETKAAKDALIDERVQLLSAKKFTDISILDAKKSFDSLARRMYNGANGSLNQPQYIPNSLKIKLAWSASPDYMIPGCHTTYKILELEHSFIGKYGNKFGVSIWPATRDFRNTAEEYVINDQKAMLYNLALVYKQDYAKPYIQSTKFGDTFVQFAFKPDCYDSSVGMDLDINRISTEWGDDGISLGRSPLYPPIGYVNSDHRYQNQPQENPNDLELLLKALYDAELLQSDKYALYQPAAGGDFNTHGLQPPLAPDMINFLTGTNYAGVPYFGFEVDELGSSFNDKTIQYLRTGTDGDLTLNGYEGEIVNIILNKMEDNECPLLDMLRYPFSLVYDSGFRYDVSGTIAPNMPMSVKKALPYLLDSRKNVMVFLSTYEVDVSYSSPSRPGSFVDYMIASKEAQRAINLTNNHILPHAESTMWGTEACRGVVIMQNCELLRKGIYPRKVPLTFEIAIKIARYAGAGIGSFKSSENYDWYPGNVLKYVKNVSSPYINTLLKETAWDNGILYTQSCDTRQQFFAGMHTVYPTQASVLTGITYTLVCAHLEMILARVWVVMTNSDFTEAEMIAKTNAEVIKQTHGIYDNRVIIIPNTYFTAADSRRGTTWNCEINAYGNVAKTVLIGNVVARNILQLGV